MKIRSLHLRGATGAVRTEMWEGREHLVVPMVALVEGVIHAVNAPSAEFVPRAAIEASVGKWAGHPIVIGHPTKNGKQISAHSPEVLAAHGCGFIRSSSTENGRLVHQTLIDPARLVALKQDALLADLRAGRGCEVSVGAFVSTKDGKSSYNGKAYDGEWTDIAPDHTALLPGGIGACSMAMGCGAHRAAMLVTAEGFEALENPEGINQYTSGGGGSSRSADRVSKEAEKLTSKANASRDNADHKVAAQAHVAAAIAHEKAGNHVYANYHRGVADAQMKLGGLKSLAKGVPMSVKNLKARTLALIAELRSAMPWDASPSAQAAASEEAAELVAYNAMRTQMDTVGDQWDAASGLIDELIADEVEDPTQTDSQEEAEEEVEDARLDAIRMHCYSMMTTLQSICNACSDQQIEDVQPSDPRYMEAFKALGDRMRAAVGKAISAKNAKVIQSAHDSSHDVHTQTVALGAQCDGMKALAGMEDCPTCGGTGQVKDDGKQQDCPTCSGDGQVRAAESLRAACGCQEADVDKKERVRTLIANEHNPVKDITEKTSDEVLAVLEASATTNKTNSEALKAAQTKQTETEAKLKVAEAAQIPAEELNQLRALAEEKKQKDATEKAALVTKLEPLKTLSKAELEAKSLEDLRTLARFAKVEVVDYSGKGTPVVRVAGGADEYAAPNPYAPKEKAAK